MSGNNGRSIIVNHGGVSASYTPEEAQELLERLIQKQGESTNRARDWIRDTKAARDELDREAATAEREAAKNRKWPEPMTAQEAESLASRPKRWLIRPLIGPGEVGLLSGKPKLGKSAVSVAIALGIENGHWPGGEWSVPSRGRVLFITWEDGAERIAGRWVSYRRQFGPAMPAFHVKGRAPQIIFPRDEEWLIQHIAANGYTLVVLDVLLYTESGQSENDAAEMKKWCESVARIAATTDAGILLLHHTAKGAKDIREAARGSTALSGLADTLLLLQEADEGRTLEVLHKDFGHHSFQVDLTDTSGVLSWSIKPASVEKRGRRKLDDEVVYATVVDLCGPSLNGVSLKEVAASLEKSLPFRVSEKSVERALIRLVNRGRLMVEKRADGSRAKLFLPRETTDGHMVV